MAKLYKYQKIIDTCVTHVLREPDYNLLETEDRITELCDIDGYTYVSVPDSISIPEQEFVTVEEVVLDEQLKAEIIAASRLFENINGRVVDRIRKQYSVNDEIKMLRIRPSEETTIYNDYVEECRDWGRAEKAKLIGE
jgi:hypothetical protein